MSLNPQKTPSLSSLNSPPSIRTPSIRTPSIQTTSIRSPSLQTPNVNLTSSISNKPTLTSSLSAKPHPSFDPSEYSVSSPSDVVTKGFSFVVEYWDDIILFAIILCVIFLFVLVTGLELKYDPTSFNRGEKPKRKIIFRNATYNHVEDTTRSTRDDPGYYIDKNESPDTSRYQYENQ